MLTIFYYIQANLTLFHYFQAIFTLLYSGYSHSSSSPLFSIGSTVSEGVRQFAETGATDTLNLEAANKTFLDTIISPPIGQGVGETTTNIFVDTNHTKVSE